MVGVHIEYHRDGRGHLQIMVLKFAGLAHKYVRITGAAIGIDQRKPSADKDGGVMIGLKQNLRYHGRGGGFAVRAGDGDGRGEAAGQLTQQLGALHGRDTAFGGGEQLGVVRPNGGGVHHQIGVADVFGGLRHKDGDAETAHTRDVVRFVDVGAGDGVALRM